MKILHISTIIEWRGGDKQMLTTYEILKDFPDLEQYVLAPEGSVLAEKCKEGGIHYFTATRRSKFSFPFLNKIIEIIKISTDKSVRFERSIGQQITQNTQIS